MTESRRLKLDLITGYLLTATRVGAWAVIFGMLLRYTTPEIAGMYAVARSLCAFVPIFMLSLPQAVYWRISIPTIPEEIAPADRHLNYATPELTAGSALTVEKQIVVAARATAIVLGVITLFVGVFVAFSPIVSNNISRTEVSFATVILLFIATVMRIASEIDGVFVQRRNLVWLDNIFQTIGELLPVIAILIVTAPYVAALGAVASALLLITSREQLARVYVQGSWGETKFKQFIPECQNLLRYGFSVSLSQAADLLYAPLTLILLGGLAHKLDVATYSTLIQFDAALLLLTAAITTTLTPRVSNLLSANDPRTALRYTFKATGISLAILTTAAVTLYFTAQPILNLWLGQVPAGLLTVLPIFLIHTVIGGASAPLRAVLLLAGKAKQLTIANTLGGLAVATATFLILKYPTYTTQTTGLLPLQAIAAATALSVTLRCALWMPWYTRKVLNQKQKSSSSDLRAVESSW